MLCVDEPSGELLKVFFKRSGGDERGGEGVSLERGEGGVGGARKKGISLAGVPGIYVSMLEVIN